MCKNTHKKIKYLRNFKKLITLKELKNLPKKQKYKIILIKMVKNKKMLATI